MASVAARRYAAAFLEVARDLRRVDQLGTQLDRAGEALRDPRIAAALASPRRGIAERIGLAEAILEGLDAPLRNLVRLLIEHGRLPELGGVISEFHGLVEEAAGVVKAEVTAAVPLDAATQSRLGRVLGEHLGREVRVMAVQDPDLLGGLVVRVGDRVIDSSLRSQLGQLQAALA